MLSLSVTSLVLVAHAASTVMMAGLIWFVQLVHYPLFAVLQASDGPAYAREHQRRTTWIVAPLMLTELVTAAWLALAPPPGVPRALPGLGLALLAVIWGSTFLIQVPDHERLARAYHPRAVRRLVWTNWIRTAAWSARAALALGLLAAGAPRNLV